VTMPNTQPRRSQSRKLDWGIVNTIARRDLAMLLRSKGVLLPIIVLPLLLQVAMPAAIGLLTPSMNAAQEMQDLQRFLTMMPEQMKRQFATYNEAQTLVVFMLVYMFAPLFLILPMMTASVIAAGSFAGEKERKTLEPLLYTPATDTELMLGKVLSAWIPAIVVGSVGFLIYSIVVNLASWETMQHVFFPTAMWGVLIVWLAPAAAALGLGTIVLVSSKVSTFQDASQLGSTVVLHVILLVVGQAAGVLYLSPGLVFAIGLVLWAVDAVVFWFAVKTFRRTEIIARL